MPGDIGVPGPSYGQVSAVMTVSGIMQGFPVPPTSRVPRTDWDRAPWNRWSFQHVREIVPTVEVWRGRWPVRDVPRAERDLDDISFAADGGRKLTVACWLDEDFTDGFIVLHRGVIIFERYLNGMDERTLHLSQSVAKSVTATVAGILIGRGHLDPDRLVTDYLPELADTAWNGALLRHVLDMTSGVRFIEEYENPDSDIALSDIASSWKPERGRRDAPACIWDQILGLTVRDREHGEIFRYKSIETDVLAHCMERVTNTRLAELVGRELWAPMGAEENANFTVDPAGYALADGGFNACLRDYARFAQLHLDGGVVDGRQIVPAAWIEDTRNGDPALFGPPYDEVLPGGAYRNQFWIPKPGNRAYMARGVFGQVIHIDPDREMVAVKLSSWPEFRSPARSRTFLAAIAAIAAALNG